MIKQSQITLLVFSLSLFLLEATALKFINRRDLVAGASVFGSFIPIFPLKSLAEGNVDSLFMYELRDRKGNKESLIREDYWYMMGKLPPRRLKAGVDIGDDPKWNAFGTCDSSGGTNSCTYVPLKQRIPAYSKYAFLISVGAKDFSKIGKALSSLDWEVAESLLSDSESGMPSAITDSLLKMVLFASSMLTTPNYSGPSRELLVARFYANEVGFAVKELKHAVDARNLDRAMAAWVFGKDSWNSYFTLVNKQISEKVGDKFEAVA
mmetsp:Transcript_26313/g.39856  ORF Transcript_26313/g.39856 Transcript_26313/m.39856 type:complete len:265 (+) Transcript_26313:63-857(+)|eukprot:CAMPEP_0178920392 /NCGR_PEP_ID=MMETSP0786-20121207/14980_1 /TAXON_ID=186022 /ORGANISM="Thalassionema frauenfeldii, Strain CCMP 1798" /LENGTH=264 /DNA_ID=CAMNT_0020594455 /DNA_START=55 /DNA_END=849 /DNA_ORIENTATION=-